MSRSSTIAAGAFSTSVPSPARSGGRQWLTLAILTIVYTTGFIDRQVLSLVLQPMKQSLAVSETQVSLLQGLAFTLAYVAFSPVFGRIVDVANRRNVLFGGVIGWSVFSIACGYVRHYSAIFVARMGVGGTEACLSPAAWSILTDSFDRRHLARAFSIFLMAPYIGGGLALIFGGAVLQAVGSMQLDRTMLLHGLEPWQITFILLGLPGLIVAGLLLLVPEPARTGKIHGQDKMRLREVFAVFRERRAFYARFFLGMAALDTLLYIVPAWLPTMLIRHYGAAPATVGLHYGAGILISGSLGVLAGPTVSRWLGTCRRGDEHLVVAAAAAVILIPLSALLPLLDGYWWTLLLGTLAGFLYSLPQSLAASAVTSVTPGPMRGLCSAVYVFIVTVLALGMGPTIVALVTDHVFADPAAVGWSLGIVATACSVLAAICLIGVLPHYRALIDLQTATTEGA